MAAWEAIGMLTKGEQSEDGGTGFGFGKAILIVTGVASLIAVLLTIFNTLLQAKNYRKPLLQRHVVRIFVLVPIFAAASWASLTSLRVAFWIDPFRDVYEAFVLYTFFQLLVNFLGGERSLIIMMQGRPPVEHLWPLNHVLGKVDISDPHTFLSIKRGILQYAWIKPVLAIATIALKATGTFREGTLGASSGYFWTALIYNVSICWSLYDLALFWVIMSADLQAFRPMPKFLSIKGIIFASWWQGFFLSILVYLGAIQDASGGYTADNLAAAIQDALICIEMPLFALSHWYAFSWTDYADRTVSDARMPMRFALRDAFGPRDLIEDAKETFSGKKYEYRYFDAENNVMAHEESSSRAKRMQEGMRYERGGRGKYWIPGPGEPDTKQPLLSRMADSHARTMSPSGGTKSSRSPSGYHDYGTGGNELDGAEKDPEEERLYVNARALEFGDWNYPVINTHYATAEDRYHTDPNMISQSTNRAILQPTKANRERRKSRIQGLKEEVHQHNDPGESSSKSRSDSNSSSGTKDKGKGKRNSLLPKMLRKESTDSAKSHSSQLVDLVVEDHQAEAIERVRARKEGGPGWNQVEQKHFAKTYPGEEAGEEVRRGFNPDVAQNGPVDDSHGLEDPFTVGDDDDEDRDAVEERSDELGQGVPWERRAVGERDEPFQEERDAWGR